MKIGIKAGRRDRAVCKEDWRDTIDLLEADQDEWDDWLEAPGAQEGAGQGRVRFSRAGVQRAPARLPQYYIDDGVEDF